jgi:hypothetical protein
VFADIRIRRNVRAVGFHEKAFLKALPNKRYYWFKGLGNQRVATQEGEMRLARPADVSMLLDLVLAAAEDDRRVVMFCSCASPLDLRYCHRLLVGEKLHEHAKERSVPLVLEEWPGGRLPPTVGLRVKVANGVLPAIAGGREWATLRRRPDAALLGIPTGAIVELVGDGESMLASVCAPRLVAGKWKVELFIAPRPDQTFAELHSAACRKRAELFLDPRRF